MTVWTEDTGKRSFLTDRFVEVAADEEAGTGFKVDFADGIVFMLDGVEDFGIDGRLGRQRIETGADEDMGLKPIAIEFPFCFGFERPEFHFIIQGSAGFKARVFCGIGFFLVGIRIRWGAKVVEETIKIVMNNAKTVMRFSNFVFMVASFLVSRDLPSINT